MSSLSPDMSPTPPLPLTHSRITLQQRPRGDINTSLTSAEGTFKLETNVRVTKKEELKDGEVVVGTEWISLDPAMRGWLNDSRSYIAPVQIGEVMRAGGVGRVVAVGPSPKFKVGDWVYGTLGWQEFATVPSRDLTLLSISPSISPSTYLGALGMPAQTAFWGCREICKLQKGETVVVSGAAGAVGLVACQIALIQGCKVIALAGGPEKCRYLKEVIGVHHAIDYKGDKFRDEFKTKVGYLDVYFDNVGGSILDLALTRLKKNARIALCGAISAYNDPNPKGIQQYLNLISQRAKIEGFIVFDYAHRYPEAEAQLLSWISSGEMKIQETELVGLDQCVNGLVGLFAGKNLGKMIVKVGAEGAKL